MCLLILIFATVYTVGNSRKYIFNGDVKYQYNKMICPHSITWTLLCVISYCLQAMTQQYVRTHRDFH